MDSEFIIYDCEYMTEDGALDRFWDGINDPDPVLLQIGAVKVNLDTFEIAETFECFVKPFNRHGKEYEVGEFITGLTGITQTDIMEKGLLPEEALSKLDSFGKGMKYWAWGKDEIHTLSTTAFINNFKVNISVNMFDNVKTIFYKTGISEDDLEKLSSGTIGKFITKETNTRQNHDALDDTLSIYDALKALHMNGKISKEWFY